MNRGFTPPTAPAEPYPLAFGPIGWRERIVFFIATRRVRYAYELRKIWRRFR